MRTILDSLLILPGVLCAYVFLLRPVLARMPQFQKFYEEANGFWAKVWALSGKSATVAWGYMLTILGAAVQFIDPVAAAVGDPDLHDQVTKFLSSDPKVLGYFAMFVAAVTIAARLHSLAKV